MGNESSKIPNTSNNNIDVKSSEKIPFPSPLDSNANETVDFLLQDAEKNSLLSNSQAGSPTSYKNMSPKSDYSNRSSNQSINQLNRTNVLPIDQDLLKNGKIATVLSQKGSNIDNQKDKRITKDDLDTLTKPTKIDNDGFINSPLIPSLSLQIPTPSLSSLPENPKIDIDIKEKNFGKSAASLKKRIFKLSKKLTFSNSVNSISSSSDFTSPEEEILNELPQNTAQTDSTDIKSLSNSKLNDGEKSKEIVIVTDEMKDCKEVVIVTDEMKDDNLNESDQGNVNYSLELSTSSRQSGSKQGGNLLRGDSMPTSGTVNKLTPDTEINSPNPTPLEGRRRSSASLDERALNKDSSSSVIDASISPIEISIQSDPRKLKLEQAIQKRKYVLMELVETEREYVKDLGTVVNGYMVAVKDQNPCPPEPLQEKEKMVWGNIEQIYDWHRDVFCKEIEKCLDNPELPGWAFVKFERRFQMYVVYCQNKPKSEYIVSEYLDTYFEEVRLKLGQKLTLPDLLIKPVQRVMKYQLLLKEYLKLTEKINTIMVDINNNKTQGEENLKLLDITLIKKAVDVMCVVPKAANDMMKLSRLQGWDGKLSAQGKLLLQDTLLVSPGPSNQPFKGKEWQVFLFEQIVLFSEPTSSSSSSSASSNSSISTKKTFNNLGYIYKNSIKTNKLSLTERVKTGEDDGPDTVNDESRFILTGRSPEYGEINFVCQASSKEAKSIWINQIKSMLSLQRDFLRALQSPIAYQKHLHSSSSTPNDNLNPSPVSNNTTNINSADKYKGKSKGPSILKDRQKYKDLLLNRKKSPTLTDVNILNNTSLTNDNIIPNLESTTNNLPIRNLKSKNDNENILMANKKINSIGGPLSGSNSTGMGLLASLRKAVSQPSRSKLNEAHKKLDELRRKHNATESESIKSDSINVKYNANDVEIDRKDVMLINVSSDPGLNISDSKDYPQSSAFTYPSKSKALTFDPHVHFLLRSTIAHIQPTVGIVLYNNYNVSTNTSNNNFCTSLINDDYNFQFKLDIVHPKDQNFRDLDMRTQLTYALLLFYLKKSQKIIDNIEITDDSHKGLTFLSWFKVSKDLNIPKTRGEKACQSKIFKRIWKDYKNLRKSNKIFTQNEKIDIHILPRFMPLEDLSFKCDFIRSAKNDFNNKEIDNGNNACQNSSLLINFDKYKLNDTGSYYLYFDETHFIHSGHQIALHKNYKSLPNINSQSITSNIKIYNTTNRRKIQDHPLTQISLTRHSSFKNHNCFPFYLFVLEPPFILWKPTISESSQLGIRLNWRCSPDITNTFATLPFIIQIQHSNENRFSPTPQKKSS
ncbi:rhoGEF domain-containing protein gxcI-like [Gordionus sp. m RMFG-2023]|uniref:rhoGEF domain-containing protein gxcI-like n=1 Tax=Gordionus sp. m RMFG-2023 TaxID=3053472 RepID=UPI0031FD7422